ncbi:hypothetical protein CROQUDRAFT_713141 [Cronartium quercuum f. sp. fusiforme G11]|uniref:Anaphase-promoting complex subunit 10 n=1 Tax=Cronartium quercuum f. sp. fusiforme G11 TaxID=708437 RepID=A0A9P6THM1_9BASI|nr:hypothetical protein CROQUDRAFT_713141 [Cronartium quercuum f. sp. fusiforme G11]
MAAVQTKALTEEVDLGDRAVWSVSSAKPGFGVAQLRDDSIHTLWQSEGPQPHFIRIEFPKKTAVSRISIFVDVTMDDSYTPCRLSIAVGSFKQDLQVIKLVELRNPRGWQDIKLGTEEEANEKDDDESEDEDDESIAIKGHLFQIAVLANHLNGKDTHIRAVKIFGPRTYVEHPFPSACTPVHKFYRIILSFSRVPEHL